MAKHYLDFVGLNTFIYETIGYDPDNQAVFFGTLLIPRAEMLTITGNEAMNGNIELNTFGNRFLVPGPPERPDYKSLLSYKNYKFFVPIAMGNRDTDAELFPALMLHRNGPYGYPTWKQVRAGENPLTRRQIKNNIFTRVREPGPDMNIDNAMVRSKYGKIEAFNEPAVTSRFKPMLFRVSDVDNRMKIFSSMGNAMCHFNNQELDKYYGFDQCGSPEYDNIKRLYLDGALDLKESPIDEFNSMVYSETIFPKEVYTNKSYTRGRPFFSFNWRDNRADRRKSSVDSFAGYGDMNNGFGSLDLSQQSIWPLDPVSDWETMPRPPVEPLGGFAIAYTTGYIAQIAAASTPGSILYKPGYADAGILMNNYNAFSPVGIPAQNEKSNLNTILRPAPTYSRRHFLESTSSCVAENGMNIEGINFNLSSTQFLDMNPTGSDFATGEAKWEAGDQAGKNPFYDTYAKYSDGVRQKGQGYAIVPEFRISNHIPTLVAEGVDKKLPNVFEMSGGLLSANESNKDDFYKVYSTTDFLKHFEIVREDHDGFVDPAKIKLKCKAIKKFLPYDGFYPCQRTVQVAQQFFSSYQGGISVMTSSVTTDYRPLTVPDFDADTEDTALIGAQNILTPLFAPGVLFNSIKSGVACDFPVNTRRTRRFSRENENVHRVDDSWMLRPLPAPPPTGDGKRPLPVFNKRIPFRALIEPNRYLESTDFICSEPSPFANHSSSAQWDGTGDNLYKMMAHNFLAEVPNFFLQGSQFSFIASKPSDDPSVGEAVAGRNYTMRIKMYKTAADANTPQIVDGDPVITPQYGTGSRESFTMYSRPTAFGPPQFVTASFAGLSNPTGPDSRNGENYNFTPPYYYGQAWADIRFVAPETKKYTIGEIQQLSTVKYYRYLDPNVFGQNYVGATIGAIRSNLYNDNAMQLSASINLFAQGEVKSVDLFDDNVSDKVQVAVDVSDNNAARWVIHPYFETPMLNFNHLSASDSITLPLNGSQSVPRGMWHQYGRIETDNDKGIFLQISDVPNDFAINVSGSENDRPLKDLCGFGEVQKRLGQVAQSKIIREAVVAVPFIEELGERKFFKISHDARQIAKSNILSESDKKTKIGASVLNMFNKMSYYILPPSMDFYHRKDVDPFAMYIFEFSHRLSQQDLADIWQNLPPSIGKSFETSEVTIGHNLLAHELLGGGDEKNNGKNIKGPPLPERVKWMVFKAKQRAETNYYNKIVGEGDTILGSIDAFEAASILRPEGLSADLSYNWPYDFFSLVELVKIQADVTLSDLEGLTDEDVPISPKRGNIQRPAPQPEPLGWRPMAPFVTQVATLDVANQRTEETEAAEVATSVGSRAFTNYQQVITNFGSAQQDLQSTLMGGTPGMGPVDIQQLALDVLQGGFLPDQPSNEEFNNMVQQIQQAASNGQVQIQNMQQLTQLMTNMMVSMRSF